MPHENAKNPEAIAKKLFRPIPAVMPRLKSSTYLWMSPKGTSFEGAYGLRLGLALIANENPNFEMASKIS